MLFLQLKIEQTAGGVFEGWEEGRIYFPRTDKYMMNSDCYVVQTSNSKEKRRPPAWRDSKPSCICIWIFQFQVAFFFNSLDLF